MSGCTCTARCRRTASYGRKLVETMARPFVCAMAQRTISSGNLLRNSALALAIRSGVIENDEDCDLSGPQPAPLSAEPGRTNPQSVRQGCVPSQSGSARAEVHFQY